MFDSAGDSWAVDNVKVYHLFKKGWSQTSAFIAAQANTVTPMQLAQCCYDTTWCESVLSESELAKCADIPNYSGTLYVLQGAEMFIVIAVFVSILKFIYVAAQNFLVRRRYPFQDEVQELLRVPLVLRAVPTRFHPKEDVDNPLDADVAHIHRSARVINALSIGDSQVVETEEEKKKRRKEEKRQRRLMNKQSHKKINSRKNKDNMPGGGGGGDQEHPDDVEMQAATAVHAPVSAEHFISEDAFLEELKDTGDTGVPRPAAADKKVDESQKQDLSLRRPIELEDMQHFRRVFGTSLIFTVVLMFVYESGTLASYSMAQTLNVYGQFSGEILLTSGGILFFAFVMDVKDLYWVVKNAVPLLDVWVPPVTIDTTFEFNALYVGHSTVSLLDVTEGCYLFSSLFLDF